MEFEHSDKKQDSVYSTRIRAGKRRTYFFDIRATRGNDFFLTITESRKRFDNNGYDRHKIFLYKEDFNKFIKALGEAVDHVKTELMPDFDFDAFNHEYPEGEEQGYEGNGYQRPASGTYSDQPEYKRSAAAPAAATSEAAAEEGPAPAEPLHQERPAAPSTDAPHINPTANEDVDKW